MQCHYQQIKSAGKQKDHSSEDWTKSRRSSFRTQCLSDENGLWNSVNWSPLIDTPLLKLYWNDIGWLHDVIFRGYGAYWTSLCCKLLSPLKVYFQHSILMKVFQKDFKRVRLSSLEGACSSGEEVLANWKQDNIDWLSIWSEMVWTWMKCHRYDSY